MPGMRLGWKKPNRSEKQQLPYTGQEQILQEQRPSPIIGTLSGVVESKPPQERGRYGSAVAAVATADYGTAPGLSDPTGR